MRKNDRYVSVALTRLFDRCSTTTAQQGWPGCSCKDDPIDKLGEAIRLLAPDLYPTTKHVSHVKHCVV